MNCCSIEVDKSNLIATQSNTRNVSFVMILWFSDHQSTDSFTCVPLVRGHSNAVSSEKKDFWSSTKAGFGYLHFNLRTQLLPISACYVF